MCNKYLFFLLFSGFVSLCPELCSQNISIANFTFLSATQSVEKYSKIEAKFDVFFNNISTVQIFNSNPQFNLYDPDIIQVDVEFISPSSQSQIWPAFFFRGIRYCDQPSSCPNTDYWQPNRQEDGWRVRFTPNEEGTWTVIVQVKIGQSSTTSNSFTFNCYSSLRKGFATLSSNLIEFSNGDLTMAIGENIAYHPGNSHSNPPNSNSSFICTSYCYNRYAKIQMETWLTELSDYGGNYARIWFVPYSWELEPWGGQAGNYDARQYRAFEFDQILNHAENKNLLVHLVISDRDALRSEADLSDDPAIFDYLWDENPYKNTFSLNDPSEFFNRNDVLDLFLKKIRYIIARWGYSPSIFAFEIMNEFDQILWTCSLCEMEDIVSWHQKVSNYIKSYNTRFLTTASTAIPRAADDVLALSEIDFSTSHVYSNTMHSDYERSYTTQRMIGTHDGKPSLMTETAFAHCWGADITANNSFHNTIWSNFFSGSFGTPLYWNWISTHHPNWSYAYYNFAPLRSFMNQIPFNKNDIFYPVGNARVAFNELDVSDQTYCAPPVAPQEIDCYGYSSEDWAVGPFLNPNTPNLEYLSGGIITSNNEDIEVHALKNSSVILGWVHNKHEYWYNLEPNIPLDGGSINYDNIPCPCLDNHCNQLKINSSFSVPNLEGEHMIVSGVCNGKYKIEWYNTYETDMIPFTYINDVVETNNSTLNIYIPPLLKLNNQIGEYPDYAFKITLIDEDVASWQNILIATDPEVKGAIAIPPTSNRVFYASKDNRIYSWKWASPGWILDTPASVDNCNIGHLEASESNKIYYRKCNGSLFQMYYDNAWQVWPININANSVHGNIAVTPNGQVFHIGINNQVDHWYWSPYSSPSWNYDILSWSASSDIEESPTGQVYYRGLDGHLRQLSWNGTWNDFPISYNNSQKIPLLGEITVSPNHDIYYRGNFNQIHYWKWTGSWSHQIIPTTQLICGDIESSPSGKIYYHGCDDHIYELNQLSSNTWANTKITNLDEEKITGDIEIAPDGSIFYRSQENSLRRLFYSCGIEYSPNPLIPFSPESEKRTEEAFHVSTLKNHSNEFLAFPNPIELSQNNILHICLNESKFGAIDFSNKIIAVKIKSIALTEILNQEAMFSNCLQIQLPMNLPPGMFFCYIELDGTEIGRAKLIIH